MKSGEEAAKRIKAGLTSRLRVWLFMPMNDKAVEKTFDGDDEMLRRIKRFNRMYKMSVATVALAGFIIVAMPFLKPMHVFRAVTENPNTRERILRKMVSLDEPNLTDGTIISWAATSITEILTLGFGDFDRQMASQRKLFTSSGWRSFNEAMAKSGIREKFKSSQLILTSVPSDSPLVSGRGIDQDGDYVWIVEMPLIMTYATNNEVTQKSRGIVRLTISRVRSGENPAGIAIKSWNVL